MKRNFLLSYLKLCPQNDVTSHPICINQNIEYLGNQECYHNKINAILHHFGSSFKHANKNFCFIVTLNCDLVKNPPLTVNKEQLKFPLIKD